jgi:hypothetical protein
LTDPRSVKADAIMPPTALSALETEMLARFLGEMK